MASFMAVDGHCANVLRNSPLVNVHCVSKEDFIVRALGLGCIDLVCRQVHLSFVDKMAERRVALVPCTNGRVDVEGLFGTANSPVLISILTSCELKVNKTWRALSYIDLLENSVFFIVFPYNVACCIAISIAGHLYFA